MGKFFKSNELYDTKTLFTLSGASMGVWLFTAVLANVLNINTQNIKWVGLIVALFIAYLGAINLGKKINLSLATVAFFNGLLIYITASGIDSINHNIKISDKSSIKKESSLLPFTDTHIWWAPKELEDSITALTNTVKIKDIEILKLQNELQLLKNEKQFISDDSVMIKSSNKEKVKVEASAINSNIPNFNNTNKKTFSVDYKTILVKGKYGLLDNNDTLIKPIYDKIVPYKCYTNQYFIVSLNNLWGVLDIHSKLRIAIKQKSLETTKTALEASEIYRKGEIIKIGL